jgi:hypothetical protein
VSHLDGRPTPAAKLGWCRDYHLRVQCDGCGRKTVVEVNALLDVLTLPPNMPLWQMAGRLRRRACGERAGRWDVADGHQIRRGSLTPGSP